jgi:hypothetical protein
LARSEVTGGDGELAGEADAAVWGNTACSGDEAGGSCHRRSRIALDAAPYLARGQNHDKHVVQMVSSHDRYGGSGELKNARNTHETQGFYPGWGQVGPYVQQLMILVLKNTQNLGGYNRCGWMSMVGG